MEKSLKIKLGIGIGLFLIAFFSLAVYWKGKLTPSEIVGVLEEYYQVSEDEAVLILETEEQEERAEKFNDSWYLPLELVTEVLAEEFYFDAEEQILSYALPEELIRVSVGESTYSRNGVVCTFSSPVLVFMQERYYISLEFTGLFANIAYEVYEKPNRVVVQYRFIDQLCYDVAKEAPVRFKPSIKSEIIRYVPEGETLYYIGGTGSSGSSFLKVMLSDGIYGYVQKKYVSSSYYASEESPKEKPVYIQHTLGEAVRLGWHVVTVPEANAKLETVVENAKEMNVISPTWYSLSDNEGNFTSLADVSYVERAHEMGLQVWALIDNFSKEVNSYELLSSTKARDTLIDRMIEEAKTYGFDGWNIDFESLASKTGPHFVQFLKELSIRCHAEGLILSVDNPVPARYNALYDLETQGKVVDYVIIMAYDEHYSGSSTAGSVASLGFLKDAVNNTLQVVSKERIVMGIPFYTRIWAEETVAGTVKVSSETLFMNKAKNFLEKNGLTARWDADTGQNYVEYTLSGVKYKIWLEDIDSLTERLNVIGGAGVAGVAAWRLGMESEEVWQIIGNYIK